MTAASLPRITFVLGKGGVGRSTVAAALGSALAASGRRTCVFGWAADDPIGPWFGLPPSTLTPQRLTHDLYAANYRLDETLELYFSHHLRVPRFYRYIIRSAHVREMIDAAPGLAEVFFVGHLWWLTTLAREEAGLAFDNIVVDAPATGHGASLFDVPAVLSSLPAAGLLALETDRVVQMMADPARTGALVVTLAEELAVEETAELLARLEGRLGRPPMGLLVNRSATHLRAALDDRSWLTPLTLGLSDVGGEVLQAIVDRLSARVHYEGAARAAFAPQTILGALPLPEEMTRDADTPRAVVAAVAEGLETWLTCGPEAGA